MPQSLSNILVHLVFSTKDRAPLLDESWGAALQAYVGGIIRPCDGDLIGCNFVRDHVHLLLALPRTMSIADLVREIKTGATKWIHQKDIRGS